MPTSDHSVSTQSQDQLPFRTAMEAKDLAAVRDAFAPDARLRSPLTNRLVFTGRDQIAAVTEVIFEVFEDFRYTGEVRSGDTVVLLAQARVGGEDLETAEHLRLGPDGKITEATVFFRPLPGTTAALRLIGAGLGRRKSPALGLVMSVLTRPLAFVTRSSDGFGVRLVRSAL